MIDLTKYIDFISKHKTKVEMLEANISATEKQIDDIKKSIENHTEAREIVTTIGVATQKKATSIIEDLTTKALQTVFGDRYSFVIESKINRNKVEAFMYVEDNGERQSLKTDVGGSVIDVVSFALRIISWALNSTKLNNVIILDEPARCVSLDKIPLFSEMLTYMSELLGIQFIIISHFEELALCADKKYTAVKGADGITTLT